MQSASVGRFVFFVFLIKTQRIVKNYFAIKHSLKALKKVLCVISVLKIIFCTTDHLRLLKHIF